MLKVVNHMMEIRTVSVSGSALTLGYNGKSIILKCRAVGRNAQWLGLIHGAVLYFLADSVWLCFQCRIGLSVALEMSLFPTPSGKQWRHTHRNSRRSH